MREINQSNLSINNLYNTSSSNLTKVKYTHCSKLLNLHVKLNPNLNDYVIYKEGNITVDHRLINRSIKLINHNKNQISLKKLIIIHVHVPLSTNVVIVWLWQFLINVINECIM